MAEAKIQETMEGVFKAVSKDLEKIEPTAAMKINSSIENCFKRSGDNADRFASCMVDTQKRVQ